MGDNWCGLLGWIFMVGPICMHGDVGMYIYIHIYTYIVSNMLIDHAIYVNYFRMRVLSKLREVRGEGHVDHQHDEGLRGQRSTMRFHVYY